MNTINEPGIYPGFDVGAYFDDPCPAPSLTQSIAKILCERSPAHARAEHPRLAPPVEAEDDAPEKYDAAKAIGNAAHALLIGRGKRMAVGEYPTWQTKLAKEFKAAALAAGQEPILAKHMARAETMAKAAREQLFKAGWISAFTEGHGEVVVAWQENGLWFRTLIDWMVDTTLVIDLKSTAMSCAPHSIPSLMVSAGWDIQAAMHERALDAVDPDNRGRRKFRFVAIEQDEPFALTPVEIGEAVLTMGRKRLQFAVDQWRRCMETDTWPAYPLEVCRPEYPGYLEARWLEREVGEQERRQRNPRQLESMMGG